MFKHTMPVAEWAAGQMVRGRGVYDPAPPRGLVGYELLRGGRILVPRLVVPNGIVNTAKNSLLDLWFNSGSDPGTTWGIGLIAGATFTSLQATDTITVHTGWTEYTHYTVSGNGSNRGTWSQGAASGQAVTNSSPVVYDFTGFVGTETVQGILVAASITKGGTAGLLWSTAQFLAPLTVESGDQLRVTYTVQL